jgi:predicted PhzF superfamily epimerase YddE/YHI9
MMKHTNRQDRLEQLRLREAEGTLTEQEQVELLDLFAELDAEEAEALKPAKEKSRKFQEEKAELEETALQLQEIVTEHRQLLTDARAYLTQLQSKRALLADKYYRLTGQSLSKEYIS